MLAELREMSNPIRNRTATSSLFFLFELTFRFVCLVASASGCSAATCISVRVLDARSGKPIKGLAAVVVTDQLANIRIGETDAQGVVRYCPNDPVPPSFSLDFEYFYPTDAGVHFDTESILKVGNVAKNAYSEGKFHDRENAKPGGIVVFGRRWWLIDRWLGNWP